MKSHLTVIAIIALGGFLNIIGCGCATILKGNTETVNLSSEPPAAKAYVNGYYVGSTPVKVKLDSNKSHEVVFQRDGFEKKAVIIKRKVDEFWIIGDIIFGIFPLFIDAGTGLYYYLDQSDIRVLLDANH